MDQLYRKMKLTAETLTLLDQEEIFWYTRCHQQWLLKGDNNTSYFHRIVNGRKRKNTIISLESEGNIIEGTDDLLKHSTDYYSDLFGPEESHNIHIDQRLWDELVKVSEEENDDLCRPFF